GRPVSDAYLGGDDPDRPPEPPSVEPRSFLQLTRLFIHADRLATDELRRDPDDARLAWLALSDERIGGNELAFGWPASRRRLLADLLTVLDEHEAAMRAYETAMAELERIGAFPDLARAELGYARLNADNGATRVAIRCCTSAERHFNRLGMPIFEARAVSLRRQLGVRSQTSAERSRWGGNFAVILMTDLVGSSATADEDGDDVYYRRVLEHLDTARHHIRAPAGREVDTTGDGIIAWFRDVESCEASARAILDAHDADDPEHGRSGVRIALDAGDAYWRDGRPFGGLVNRTARVAGLAAPGSILTTADVRRSSPEPRAYEPAGTQAVKGMAQPLELYWYTPETTGR
ncbi:MAG: adenylate/guanylate cyclase domain-containing protein, partial [Actinomycetota bacterium]|nr:adenylate/guanylate cyclase domain-containing protein [Actinomycetota bacterium]